ncbi:MAG TPA: nitroreductase/quinone reductase family protein [Actinotalea sp.]|nr:nitroreductase/quinone reductase family protein [Actinotalea sp.]
MPSRLTLAAMNAVHRALIVVTRGRVGWSVAGMPALELTTTGRRSGRPRTAMLTAPARLDGNLVIVASRGGDDAHPAWFVNLCAQPEVLVAVGAPPTPMQARVLSSAERAALWPEVTAAYSGYAAYQRRTSREIPLVVLEPGSGLSLQDPQPPAEEPGD